MLEGRKNLIRWLGLSISFLATVPSGFGTAFNVYALALKETFDYTQTQVEIVPSVGMWGFPASIVQAGISWKFGHNVTYAVIWILSPVSIGLLYIGTVYRDFFHNWPVLIGIFHFIVNVNNNMFQLLVCLIGVQNFGMKHVGKILGTYGACMGFGKIFFAGLFGLFFSNNLGGFFLYTGLICFIAYGLTFLLHRPVTDEKEKTHLLESDDMKQSDKCASTDEEGSSSIKSIWQSPYFHAVFWSSVVFCSSFDSFMNNVTSIAHSTDLDDPVVIVYVLSAAMIAGNIFFSNVYDCLGEIFHSLLLISCYSLFIMGMVVVLISFDERMVYIMTVLAGLPAAATGSIPVSMLVSRFGRHHYAILRCSLMAFVAAFMMLIQLIFGHVYDGESSKSRQNWHEDIWCGGRRCFYWSLILLICLSLLTLFTQLITFVTLLIVSIKPTTSLLLGGNFNLKKRTQT